MKTLGFAMVLAALPFVAAAQDPVKVDPGHYKVLIDNATVRVLKVDVPAGEKSAMHSHPDALLVPLSDGKAQFTMPDGKKEDRLLTKETAVYTPAGAHSPNNVGTSKVEAILVEFKTKAPGTATLPPPGPGLQLLAESPRAVAVRRTVAADFHEAPGTTHEYDQVVIALGPGGVKLAVDGQPTVTQWHRGDVRFIPRGAKHEAMNTQGTPYDVILVAIR